jgi:lipopolysaccharide/colanic/teichoic acid biosynthesis glycosyltransferase
MVQAAPIPHSETKLPGAGGRLWGLSILELHDRYWASRGVQAIRPSGARPRSSGTRLFLLLDDDQVALFDLKPVLSRMNWVKPRVLRVRIVQQDPVEYAESIRTDPSGSLIAIQRRYGPQARRSSRVLVTADARIAEQWAMASNRAEAFRTLRQAVKRSDTDTSVCNGRTGRQYDPAAEKDLLLPLLAGWSAPGTVLNGVYLYQPGVWVHQTVTIPPDARLIAPLWIGAGAEVEAGEPLVGPQAVPDAATASVDPGAVPWDLLTPFSPRLLPNWKLPRSAAAAKRMFDIVFSICALAATLPLYPLVMLLILLEDGWPPFFVHSRQTVGGRNFPCLKFRTMRKNAEHLKRELQAKNRCDGPQFFIDNDPRVLRIGKVLRRFHIDELPQFWNVLLGHMSVVGPRPSPDRENQYCPAWREARLSVRPGVTGLWQIRRTRAPATDFQEWIRYDLEYVQHQSWRLDLWIIARTITGILKA